MEYLTIISFVETGKDTEVEKSLTSDSLTLQMLPLTALTSMQHHQNSNQHQKTLVFLFDRLSIENETLRRQAKEYLLKNKQGLHFCLIVDPVSNLSLEFLSSQFLSLFHDLFFWPCQPAEITARIARFRKTCTEPQANKQKLLHEFIPLNLIGKSPAFIDVLSLIKKVSCCDVPVLIEGETGTGKENAARAIHYLSNRSDYSFIPINCGALPDELLESELFGHSKGAFTDAKEKQEGLVAIADGGTLFLDEIDSLSPKAQAALLRFLQTGEYRPLGSKTMSHANVRVIAASNAVMENQVKSGAFREDLLFRINVLHIDIPPLRHRPGDLEILAESFLKKFAETYNSNEKNLTTTSLQWLNQQPWPGNIRELENTLLRHFLMAEDQLIHIAYASSAPSRSVSDADDCGSFQAAKAAAIRQFEQNYLQSILRQTSGNVSEAARVSGKERRALGKLLQKYQIEKEQYYSAAESY